MYTKIRRYDDYRGSNIEIRLLCKPKNPPLLIQTKSKGRGTSLHLQFYLAWIQESCNFWCSLKRKRYASLPTKYKMMYWPFVNIPRYSQKSWEVVLTFFISDHREDKYFACGYSARMWWHRKMGHWLLPLCPEDIKPQCHWILQFLSNFCPPALWVWTLAFTGVSY